MCLYQEHNYTTVCIYTVAAYMIKTRWHLLAVNTAPVVCNDTDVRLRDGRTSNEGRVEICYYDNWGTICDDGFTNNNAQVLCRQLGYPANGK